MHAEVHDLHAGPIQDGLVSRSCAGGRWHKGLRIQHARRARTTGGISLARKSIPSRSGWRRRRGARPGQPGCGRGGGWPCALATGRRFGRRRLRGNHRRCVFRQRRPTAPPVTVASARRWSVERGPLFDVADGRGATLERPFLQQRAAGADLLDHPLGR
jgi:hypothetical protein